MKNGVEALKRVEALLLPVLDLAPPSLFYSSGMLAGGLTQGLQQVVQDPRAIIKV